MTSIASGLYRTTQAHPFDPTAIPEGALVFVGDAPSGGGQFVVRPGRNVHNRWYWGEPTTPLPSDPLWVRTLRRLPAEGFYTLPEDLRVGDTGVWRKNAIVQLGYNPEGQGILFVGERHEGLEVNALFFSDRGVRIPDELLYRLTWAPILPVSPELNS
ncbi:MAG TPA: hypothetical protein VFZ61_23630 [Polyangiales bacterium]